MIDALITGRLHGDPQSRTSRAGNTFVTAVVRTTAREGAVLFVNAIAFDEKPVTALLALSAGDAIALAGELTPKVYQPQGGEPRPSLDLVAHAVLTEYNVARRRKATRGENAEGASLDDALPPIRSARS